MFKKKIKAKASIFLLLFAIVALSSCARSGSQEERMLQTGEALVETQQVIVEVATAADQFCSSGFLDQSQCDKISIAYSRAKVYYDLTATAYETALAASENSSEDAWKRYESVHANFTRLYADMLALAAAYGIEAAQ